MSKTPMEQHTIESPLRLIWDGSTYKVNKPQQETQELVSLDYATRLIAEHKMMKETIEFIAKNNPASACRMCKTTLKQLEHGK